MIIGNPLYNTAFEFLMQDPVAAKKFVSLVIQKEVLELRLKLETQPSSPEEANTRLNRWLNQPIVVLYRLDFSATIRLPNGSTKRVLIEVQKAQEPADIVRFRKYLGHQYQTAHTIVKNDDGTEVLEEKDPLPISSIYLLGFKVTQQPVPVIKANSQYVDVLYNQPVDAQIDFIEWLRHDVFVIQTPHLRQSLRTPLEQLLALFDQSRAIHGRAYLLNFDVQLKDEELQHIARQLEKLAASPELQELMDVEFYQKYNLRVLTNKLVNANRKAEEANRKAEVLKQEKEEAHPTCQSRASVACQRYAYGTNSPNPTNY